MNGSQTNDATLFEIFGALRRIWIALKERIVPSHPVPVPVPIPSEPRR